MQVLNRFSPWKYKNHGGSYHEESEKMYAGGDYFVQEIVLKPVEDKILNKYGTMRRAFL